MKILFEGRPIRAPLSGVARYCLNLSSAIDAILSEKELGEISVYCQNWKNKNDSLRRVLDQLPKNSIVDSKFNSKFYNGLTDFFPIFGPSRRYKNFDIVHETYFANLGEKKRTRKVVTIHDVIPLEFPEYFNYINRFFSKKNFYRQCREADHIICVSEYTKKKIYELTGRTDAVSVIPCGVESGVANTPAWDEEYLYYVGLKDVKYIFYIGNIEPRKNLTGFAKAFKEAMYSDEKVRFVVAGHKNFKAAMIIEEIKLELGDRFIYLGEVTDAQKWCLYKNASLFAFPSHYEGFGIPILEAYSSGCTPIMSNNSSLLELAVSPGQLFDERSIESMKNTIRRSLGDVEFSARVGAAAKEILKNYSWFSVAKKTIDVYDKLS